MGRIQGYAGLAGSGSGTTGGVLTVQPATVNLWPQPLSLVYNAAQVLRPESGGSGQVFGYFNNVAVNGTMGRSEVVTRSGPFSLVLAAPATPGGPGRMQCNTPPFFLARNQQYVITCWVRGDPSYGTVAPSMTGGTVSVTPTGVVPQPGVWQRIQAIVSAPFHQNTATFVLAGGSATPNAGAQLFVTDIQIELGTTPTAYCDGALTPQQRWCYYPPAFTASTLTTTVGGGSILAGRFWAMLTLVTAAGETLPGPAFSVDTTGGSSSITMVLPALPGGIGATGWNVYYTKNDDQDINHVYRLSNVTGTQTVTSYLVGGGGFAIPTTDTSGITGAPVASMAYVAPSARAAGTVATSTTDLVLYGTTNLTEHAIGINKPFVNLKDFGGVGDGVNDDTASITAALAAVPAGGTLYVPAGNYVDTLQRSPTCYIVGDGPQASILQYKGSSISNFSAQLSNAGVGIDRPTATTSVAAQASCYLTFPGDRWHSGLKDIGVLGQMTLANVASARFAYPSAILLAGNALIDNVYISGFDAGIVVDTVSGHWLLNKVHTQLVWYGIYSIVDGGDGIIFESEIQAIFACYANHSQDSNQTLMIRCQIYGSVYGFYHEFNSTAQPVTTSGQVQALVQDGVTWFQNSRWYGTHFEIIRAGYIYSEKAAVDLRGPIPQMNGIAAGVYTPNPSNTTGSICRDCEWNQPVATWYNQVNAPITNTYGRPVDYGIVVGGMANCQIDGYFQALPLGWMWVASLQNTATQMMGLDVRIGVGPQAIGNYAVTVGNYQVGGVRIVSKQVGATEGIATIPAGSIAVQVPIPYALGARLLNAGTPGAYNPTAGAKANHGTPNATNPWAFDTAYVLPRVQAQQQPGPNNLVGPFALVVSMGPAPNIMQGYTYQEIASGSNTIMQAGATSAAQTAFTITCIPTAGDAGLTAGNLKTAMQIYWKI